MYILNKKGMTVVEIVLTFSIIMIITVGMLLIMVNYHNKVAVSLERLRMETFKNNLTQDIYSDILKLGIERIEEATDTTNPENPCYENINLPLSEKLNLNRCVVLYFQNGDEKVLGTSKIISGDKNSIINKFIYYDGIKYALKDSIPKNIPVDRNIEDFQSITINDHGILNVNFNVLEDGTQAYVYNIDIGISHIDYEDDFGIHIVASNIDISK